MISEREQYWRDQAEGWKNEFCKMVAIRDKFLHRVSKLEQELESMRRTRLLQAAAVFHNVNQNPSYAVEAAFRLEGEITRRLEEEKQRASKHS